MSDPTVTFPATCGTWACEVCGPAKARQKAAIISWARPERFLTLTLAPEEWQQLRKKVRVLRATLCKLGYSTEWAWTVERGKRRGMLHVHALQHGKFIPQSVLQERWGSIVDIRQVRYTKGVADYVLKEAQRVSGYALKGTAENLSEHLALNGGRGCHLSRGFLHGRTSDEVWRELHPVFGEEEWVFCRNGVSLVDALASPAPVAPVGMLSDVTRKRPVALEAGQPDVSGPDVLPFAL